MRTYSSFCGTVCSDSTGTVTSDAAVRLHRRYHAGETAVEKLAPISFNLPGNKPARKAATLGNNKGEVRIKLPGGIRVSFTGSTQTEAAINLLTQIYSSHVLSK